MSREDRKLRKHFEERAKRELRLARKNGKKADGKTKRTNSGADASGLVVETGPGFCDVLGDAGRERCRSAGDAAVGDRVLFSTDRSRIEEILPRRAVLSRSDPGNPHMERVIAANIDLVVNVVSLKDPALRPGLIDRYLIAIGKSGAEPMLCVNKIDLLEDSSDLDPLRPYRDLGLAVVCCSAATGEGIAELLERLAGKLCVLTGHSGVGKSSLLNALDPTLHLAAGEISSANQKGRHTTTSSALYHLPGGGMVIDTPGIREFGLWDVSTADIRRYFQEFGQYRCAFADCAVKRAAESGAIALARYESYLRIAGAHG
jgi:ribosome biogenesis GTPase